MVRGTSKGGGGLVKCHLNTVGCQDTTLEPNFLISKAPWQRSRAKLGVRRPGSGEEGPARHMMG